MAGLGWQELVILGVILVILAVPIYGLLWLILHRSGNRGSGAIHGHPYAGFWHRVGGEMLDVLILSIVAWLIAAIVARLIIEPNGQFVDEAIVWLFSLAYTVIGNGRGGTFGKQLARLRVVDATGAVAGIGRAAVRAALPYGLRLISLVVLLTQLNERPTPDQPPLTVGTLLVFLGIMLLMTVDYLWMIWDARKQTLHDKLAGTFVVSTDPRENVRQTYHVWV